MKGPYQKFCRHVFSLLDKCKFLINIKKILPRNPLNMNFYFSHNDVDKDIAKDWCTVPPESIAPFSAFLTQGLHTSLPQYSRHQPCLYLGKIEDGIRPVVVDKSLLKICHYQQNVPQHYYLLDTLVTLITRARKKTFAAHI